jgi:competence protein ComEC
MGAITGLLWCGAYCAGLFIVSLLVRHWGIALWPGVAISGASALLLSGVAALLLPRFWRTGPRRMAWLATGLIGLAAVFNYGWQYPVPAQQDVSHWLERGELAGAQQEVWGSVKDMPRQTRSGKGQFSLYATLIRAVDEVGLPLAAPELVTGQLYATVPVGAIENVFPGQPVRLEGKLYQPEPPKNPYAFDFRQYLADQHTFAGFSGKYLELRKNGAPGWWRLWRVRVRIARAHEAGLGTPAGPLVSAMALGRQAVQVPYDIQDTFIQAGLAHTLAASGFHVSLVLGVVLAIMGHPAITSRVGNPAAAKVVVGLLALAGYVLLTGGQPSVMRASLMGVGALIGLATERRVNPLGCLLVAVTLLLVWNPTWIDSIGFRLSVMATLGLIVSVKPLTAWLEWLPTTLATIVAVPVAAYFWTIPLSLFYFQTLTTYSILLNMLVTPLVMVISLGGILSGLIAVAWPTLGSVLALVLWLPAHVLIWLVHWETSLPGSSVATGHIALWQMLGLYGLYVLGWQHCWLSKRRWVIAVLLLVTAFGPLWLRAATLSEITVLAAGKDAVMVVRHHRSTLLVDSGTEKTAFYTVVPFLRQAGINRVSYAVNWLDSDPDNWSTVLEKAPVQNFYSLTHDILAHPGIHHFHILRGHEDHALGQQQVTRLDDSSLALRFDLFGGHPWLLLPKLTPEQQNILSKDSNLSSEVLWWHGEWLAPELVAAVQPKVAIASTAFPPDTETEQNLIAQGVQVFCTGQDGAMTWTPRQHYQAYLGEYQHHQPASFE